MSKRNASRTTEALAAEGDSIATQAETQDSNPVPAPTNNKESKADKFKRLARRRMAKASKAIRDMIPLGNSNAYAWTPSQASQMIDYLWVAVDELAEALNKRSSASAPASWDFATEEGVETNG